MQRVRTTVLGILLTSVLTGCTTASHEYPDTSGGDLDCADIGHEIYVTGSDPHGLDRDGDGIGCEGW